MAFSDIFISKDTYFFKRGIRLPEIKKNNIQITTIDIGKESNKFRCDITHLEKRLSQFAKQKGTKIVVRLTDEDAFCFTQRALTESLKNKDDEVQDGVAFLKKHTGAELIYWAAHKGQDIGKFGKLSNNVLRIDSRHYPMMSQPLIAKRILTEKPILDQTLQVKGVLVLNISDLRMLQNPDSHMVTTVITSTETYIVRLRPGTPIKELLAAMELDKGVDSVIIGSPLTGSVIYDLDAPVAADVLSLVATSNVGIYQNLPCCNCGKCVKVCPSKLLPGLLSKHIQNKNFEVAFELNVHSCIECACCAYVCPSKRSMVQMMREGKQERH